MTPDQLGGLIRAALDADEYPQNLATEAREWIDAMYRAHGPLYESGPEHAFAEEFLRRCGLSADEVSDALGALHP